MTVEEFAARYNQELDWDREIFDKKYLKDHPFLNSKFGGYTGDYKITPETCDYSTAKIFEDCVGTDRHYFELQIHSNEDFHGMHFWIHPDYDEKAYKERSLRRVVKDIVALTNELTDEQNEINSKLTELHNFSELLNNKREQ